MIGLSAVTRIGFLASQPLSFFRVGGQTDHALLGEGPHRANRDMHHLEQIVGDDRHHHIQLKLSGLPGERHRQIVAHDVKHRHVEHLGQHRVHLARHDARTGLDGRQADFVQAGRGAAAEQPEIVGNPDQVLRQRAQRPGKKHGVLHRLHRFEQIVALV